MIKLLDLIEAKQVGILYHFTDYYNLEKIIKDNFILSIQKPVVPTLTQTNPYISFTRNKSMKSTSVPDQIRIMIDGNKLSEHYKIEPYADYDRGYGRGKKVDESEERIDASKYGGKVDISKCVLQVDLKNSLLSLKIKNNPLTIAYNNCIELLKQKEIKYNLVQKF